MTRKFTVYLDSGANIHSKRKTTDTLDEIMKEIAFERADWGYYEEVK